MLHKPSYYLSHLITHYSYCALLTFKAWFLYTEEVSK